MTAGLFADSRSTGRPLSLFSSIPVPSPWIKIHLHPVSKICTMRSRISWLSTEKLLLTLMVSHLTWVDEHVCLIAFILLIPSESDECESEISEPEDLDRYDSTFVVDDDEILEESVADIDEESILSDPSDLFDNQTESEPESEPEIIYREKKLPHNPLIDDEAEEDDCYDEEENDDRDVLIEDTFDPSILDDTNEEESDYEGPRNEITKPLNASDFVDEEAEEHNDLQEMYDGIVGQQIISSDEEEDDNPDQTIFLGSESDEEEDDEEESEDECENDEPVEDESDVNTEILASSSPVPMSPVKAPVIIRKRRRLVVFDTDTESSVKKIIRKKRKSEVECVTLDSSLAGDNSVLSINSPLLSCNGTSIVKPVKPRSARQLILDSDDDDDHHEVDEDVENLSPETDCLPVDLNCAFLDPNDTLSSPHVDKW